ncbi:hypothetical protein [Azotobacter beijerinckii]|uniref:Uncharacterized protein n=1 Tax=Azotobacter beijerinckii TaxID=170623 RepID=A0A1I1B732_9GAMM|nr:hypothetical protein [Azotobacter beijerinckii]SFB46149.1 hypothetical protein SAMN04244571_02977 [Azotobacter beijerinckii]
MPEFTEEQRRIIRRIDRALNDAARAGLSLRVFDGAVLLMRSESLALPSYDGTSRAIKEWMEDYTEEVGKKIHADGGAGI